MRSFVLKPGIIGIIAAAVFCVSPYIAKHPSPEEGGLQYRVMFYNVENFFDTYDDSLTADEAFTPSGDMHWTHNRYVTKLKNIYKVILATGGWKPPDIIGLCEIENRQVLQDLIENTPLSKYTYHILHKNSPDRRGIDVAILYNAETIRFISSKSFKVKMPGLFTRDISYLKALVGKDTCHFFVNHWPSRSSGQLETESGRFAAARLLKHVTDSLFRGEPSAKIVIMGDFNDEPMDESLVDQLGAEVKNSNFYPAELYNLTRVPATGKTKGTLKFQGAWNVFDQIIVSGNLLSPENGLAVKPDGYRILSESFLLLQDEQFNGYKPYRTYNGFKYQGGFSDHLPVYIDIISH